MRKLCIIILLLFSGLSGYSPGIKAIYIPAREPITPYERIAYAVAMVESHGDDNAYNKKERATGRYQIRPICLREFNRQTGIHYTLKEMHDPIKSKSVFLYFASQHHYSEVEKISRVWNGGERGMKKRSTKKYYQNILKIMQEQK
jgi:hypothetical protein